MFGKKQDDGKADEPEWKKKARAIEAKKAQEAEAARKRAERDSAKQAAHTARIKRQKIDRERILAQQKDPFSQSLGEEEEGLVTKISGMFKAAILDDEDDDEKARQKKAKSLAEKQAAARKALDAQDQEKIEAARRRNRLVQMFAVLVLAVGALGYAASRVHVPPREANLTGHYQLTSYTRAGETVVSQGLLDITDSRFHLRLFKDTEDKATFVQDSAWTAEGPYVRATDDSWAWIYSYRERGEVQLETLQDNEAIVLVLAPRPAPH